jgi:hypothetical protein
MKPRNFAVTALVIGMLAASASTGLQAQGLEYPKLYTSLGLPELPRSRVLSSGHETASLREGLSIRVSALMHVNEIRKFYTDGLTKAGWTVAPPRPTLPGVPIANVQATKNRMTFTAAITASDAGATQVNLTVIER